MAEWFMEGAPPVSVNAEVLVLQILWTLRGASLLANC